MQPAPHTLPDKRLPALASVLLMLAWLAFQLASLRGYPPVTCDEAFYTDSALRFTQAVLSGSVWPQQGVRFFLPHGRAYWLMLGSAALAFGPTVFVVRVVSLLGLVALAAATYLLGVQITASKRAALWSAALVAASWIGLLAGHRARPDVWAAAAAIATVGLACSLLAGRCAWWACGLLGLVMVLQLDLHPIGVYVVSVLGLYVGGHLARERAFTALLALAAGLLLGGLIYLWLHWFQPLGAAATVPTPGAIFASHGFDLSRAGGGTLPGRLWRAGQWFAGFWWGYYAWLAPVVSLPQAALFVFGLTYTLVRGRGGPRLLGWLVVVSSLVFAVVNADYTAPPGYAALWSPLYTVLGVYALFDLPGRLTRRPHRDHWLPVGLLGGLLALYVAGDLYLAARSRPIDYTRPGQQIASAVEPESRVFGNAVWWFALHSRATLIEEATLLVFNRAATGEVPLADSIWYPLNGDKVAVTDADVRAIPPGASEAAKVHDWLSRLLRPDYVVLDGVIDCYAEPVPMAEALADVVERECTPVIAADSLWYGTQTVYACPWGD